MTEVLVAFDDEYGDVITRKAYFNAMDRYGATGLGHSDGTSSMFVPDHTDIEALRRDLGDIKSIAIR